MGRRSTPERIYTARRAAMLARLTQAARLSPARAEEVVAAWEAEAARRALERFADGFWQEGEAWLSEYVGNLLKD